MAATPGAIVPVAVGSLAVLVKESPLLPKARKAPMPMTKARTATKPAILRIFLSIYMTTPSLIGVATLELAIGG